MRDRSDDMRASAVLFCMLILAGTPALASALGQNGYLPGNAANYTSNVVTMSFTGSGVCEFNGTAVETQEPDNESESSYCEIGVGEDASQGYPLWILIPAFSGTSIFGINTLGASAQGLPVYNGNVMGVECGPGGTVASCPDHPEYSYSPMWVGIEQSSGIYNGIFGLPEGVLPVPGHTHANEDSYLGSTGKWYIIPVFVLDPNVMPNATTGSCSRLTASNLTNATSNCLDSFGEIFRAMTTSSSAVANANSGNPIWRMFGNTTLQAVVPGLTPGLAVVNPATGGPIAFATNQLNYYVGEPINTSAINQPAQSNRQPGSSALTTQMAIILIAAILIAGGIVALERRLRGG